MKQSAAPASHSALTHAVRTLNLESQAIQTLAKRLTPQLKSTTPADAELQKNFSRCLALILACRGKLIFSGMGKTSFIASKVAATFSSLGKSAFFLHPAEAAHGDLGMVGAKDLVFFFSKSGETREIVSLLPTLKKITPNLIAITEQGGSTLYKKAAVGLNLKDHQEACGLGLAPTTSTTLMLALGDALAVAYLKENKAFDERDFAFYHPGGSLGKQLRLVKELMRPLAEVARCRPETALKEVMLRMTQARIGCAVVEDEAGRLVGVFSDGDLRRSLENLEKNGGEGFLTAAVGEFMTRAPKRVAETTRAAEALAVMKQHQIGELPVVDAKGRVRGVFCLKDTLP